MTTTPSLVWVDRNKLVYLLTNGGSPLGGEGTIPSAGGATPDLATDVANSVFGEAGGRALRTACRAGLDGLGNVAAGGFTQATARALLMLNAGAANANTFGGVLAARLQCSVVPSTGTAAWVVDVDVDGSGRPEINVTSTAAAGTAYLHVDLVHSLTK